MRRLLKWTIRVWLINVVIWAVAQAITRSRTSRDLAGSELEFYTFWNGSEFVPESPSLRHLKARVLMGGATVDLRQVQPSPEGATIDVGTLLGGTAVLVSKDWDVEVVERTRASEVEVRLDATAEASSDRPKVTVLLGTSFGGALVGYELTSEQDA
jgi:hypothetical protein